MGVARRTGVAVLAAAALLAPASLVGAGVRAGGLRVPSASSSTLVVALSPDSVPTSVFPFYAGSQCYSTNIDYWNLTTRPGYWFGLGKSVSLIPSLSPLNLPTITTTGADTTATFSVKGWTWSNGSGGTETMTAQDVAFFLNMDRAQSNQGSKAFCGYVAGLGLPDQVVSVSYPDGLSGAEVRIVFAGHDDHAWLLNNELSQIVPLAKAWDTTGSGFAGCSTEAFAAVKTDGTDACTAVFNYLSGLQINDPLWDWADGPYRQESAPYRDGSPDGDDVQVVNADYSGPVKAHAVKTIVYEPYLSEYTEISDLESGKLDLGYADPTKVTRAPGPGRAGHDLSKKLAAYDPVVVPQFGVFYDTFNFDNSHSARSTTGPLPTWAKLINLQYFRIAIAESADQGYVIDHAYNGYAAPGFSAIPSYPPNPYAAGLVNPYPYNPARAKALMRSHGWNTSVFPDVCDASNCGTAQFPIARGTKATVQLLSSGGEVTAAEETSDEATSIGKASGIQVEVLRPLEFYGCSSTLFELCTLGGWIYQPDYYPSGEMLFALDSTANPGGYDSAEMQALVGATTNSGNLALNATDPEYHTSYAKWSATDVPFLWQPTPEGIGEVIGTMRGEQPPNALGDFNPEYITHI